MPREYFEKWFRNIMICKPDYRNNFHKIYDNFALYRSISNYYQINSDKLYFDTIQGKNLIKTDVIYKENFELFKKIIQQKNSNFSYVYNKNELSTIWESEYNREIKYNDLDGIFVKNSKDTNYKLYKKSDIT
jgi:hypothetical protein